MRSTFPLLTALSALLSLSVAPFAGEAFAADPAPAAAPAATDAVAVLKKAGDVLFPAEFTAKVELVSTAADGKQQAYEMMLYKLGDDKARTDFLAPALEQGRRMLRVGDQIWMYVADLKRPVKMSPKQSLMGSDFTNGDLMRLSFTEDYNAAIQKEDDKVYVLELTAKNSSVAYDKVIYTVEKKTMRSLKQEFFTKSGKLVKTMEFQEYKAYAGYERPSLFVMTNALAPTQKSVLRYLEFEPGKTLPEAQFRPDALARQ